VKRIICILTLILISACQFNSSQNQKKIDSDGDGIVDSSDDCPDTFGLEEFDGCPDTDEDGIIDSEDDCPEEFGLEDYNGCPDSDGDEISDLDDQCPNEFGYKKYNGCPDFGSQTQKLTVQNCLEIITINSDEKDEALEFLNYELNDLISYRMCEITRDYITSVRQLNTEMDELNRQIEGGYIETVRRFERKNILMSQHLIVSKKGVYYLMEVLAGGECTMGTMKFDENSTIVQDVWVRESPDEERYKGFKMKIIDKSNNFTSLNNKLDRLF
tara:strand:+ start:460 stop:1275 length:816 start_codon:yes stop_codon:yes gene_type:complete